MATSNNFSNYLELKVLDHIMGKASFTMPTAYVALSTADPTEDGSGIAEPAVASAYARVATAAGDWNAASGGTITNANKIQFATPTANWGLLAYWAIFDNSAGGNMLVYGALTAEKQGGIGADVNIPAGSLSQSLN